MKKNESKEETRKGHKLLNFILFIIVLIVSIVLYAKYLGTKGLEVREYKVDSNILTSNFSGIKIVHISDMLYKSTFDKNDLNKLVKRVNELKPDIVVFTGDLVSLNAKITDQDIELLIQKLSSIDAKIGKYCIYGDADYSFDKYESVMHESGFIILNNEYDEIYYNSTEPMYIVGLPSSIKENIKLEDAFKFYSDENRKYTICLVHDGKTIKYIDNSTYEVDLILAGHSLNGSVIIPFYKGLFVDESSYKYYDKTYTKGITNIYVSGGLGTNKYDYRFLNKPSFNLYRLKAQS